MLPETQNQPTLLAELSCSNDIALAVAGQLLHPVATIRFGQVAVAAFGTTVPEASIDKNGDSRGAENKVGSSRNPVFEPVSTHSTRRQLTPKAYFGFRIPRTNPRHVEGASTFVVNVHFLHAIELAPLVRKSTNVNA